LDIEKNLSTLLKLSRAAAGPRLKACFQYQQDFRWDRAEKPVSLLKPEASYH